MGKKTQAHKEIHKGGQRRTTSLEGSMMDEVIIYVTPNDRDWMSIFPHNNSTLGPLRMVWDIYEMVCHTIDVDFPLEHRMLC